MSRHRIPFRMHRSGWIIPAFCAFIGIHICGFGWRLGLPAGALMVGSLLLHEEGHMLAATALGVPVREFGLCMGGAYIRRAPARCRRDEVLISAAGPLLNLCLVLPLVFLPRIGGQIALCNLVLGIVNLIPFPSSDGLRILRMLGSEHTRLVSTDGNRFSLVKLSGASAESLAILIPRAAIEPLMALTGAGGANEIAVAVDDTRICLSGGARQLAARRVTGNFPNYEAVLPTGQGTQRRPPTLAARDRAYSSVRLFPQEELRKDG